MITAPMYYADDYEAPAPKVCALCDAGFPINRNVNLQVMTSDGTPTNEYVSMSYELAQKIKAALDKHAE